MILRGIRNEGGLEHLFDDVLGIRCSVRRFISSMRKTYHFYPPIGPVEGKAKWMLCSTALSLPMITAIGDDWLATHQNNRGKIQVSSRIFYQAIFIDTFL